MIKTLEDFVHYPKKFDPKVDVLDQPDWTWGKTG